MRRTAGCAWIGPGGLCRNYRCLESSAGQSPAGCICPWFAGKRTAAIDERGGTVAGIALLVDSAGSVAVADVVIDHPEPAVVDSSWPAVAVAAAAAVLATAVRGRSPGLPMAGYYEVVLPGASWETCFGRRAGPGADV